MPAERLPRPPRMNQPRLSRVGARMDEEEIYRDPSKVRATDGKVQVDGPDSVDVTLTPEAAEETADRLIEQSIIARGQRIMKTLSIRPKDRG